MVNLVEFDSLYGHRRNVEGYKRAIEDFDYQLGGLLDLLKDDDLLIITADYGTIRLGKVQTIREKWCLC